MAKYSYNLQRSKVDLRDFHYTAFFFNHPALLPKVVDLRTLQSPVRDQGNVGFCFSFATTSLREYLEIKNKQIFVELSELYLAHKTKQKEGTEFQDNGASIADAMWALHKFGVCPAQLDPYKPANYWVTTTTIEDAAAKKFAIKSYYKVTNLTALKTALAEGYVVVIGIAIYDSFESDEVINTGKVPLPNTQLENCLGGHAILAVGYSDIEQHVIIKNSWGASVGDKGYFYIPYTYINDPNLCFDMYTTTG